MYDIDTFDIIICKAVYNFKETLLKSENTVVGAIVTVWGIEHNTILQGIHFLLTNPDNHVGLKVIYNIYVTIILFGHSPDWASLPPELFTPYNRVSPSGKHRPPDQASLRI